MPMAGKGSRFASANYDVPKPLIKVRDRYMFSWALDSLSKCDISKLIVIVLQEHVDKYNIDLILKKHWGGVIEIVVIPEVSDGQLCTVMYAYEHFNSEEDIIILSSDTFIVSNIHNHIQLLSNDVLGLISIIKTEGDNWSFVKLNEKENVVEVAEKVRISDNACTGLYYFSRGIDFINISREVIKNKIKMKGEYYIMAVYSLMLAKGEIIQVSRASEMHDMGSPISKEVFEKGFYCK